MEGEKLTTPLHAFDWILVYYMISGFVKNFFEAVLAGNGEKVYTNYEKTEGWGRKRTKILLICIK